jgi:NAD(P)-dependent dehydrogenase (short-subunit alcohol dehydrogenase family)
MSTFPFTLITGASSGIGREVAIRLSRQRRLLLHGRDQLRLEETRLRCQQPEIHQMWNCDFRSPEEIEGSVRPFFETAGVRVECFVHCAGMLTILPLRNIELPRAREIMNVNFHAAAEIARLLMKKRLNEQCLKRIIFISSVAGKFGAKGFSAYSASKGALDAMMRSLAVELAPAVTANSILPGTIQTAMTKSMLENPETLRSLEKAAPLGIGVPADIAATVEFLLSDGARWITGQQIVVDGGQTTNISV